MTTDTPDLRVLAIISHAQTAARSLGRPDSFEAIYDLLVAEIPQAEQNAIGWYLATEKWDDYCAALRVLGVDRDDEYGRWCFDIMRELGTWVTWDLGEGRKYGLSQFQRWTPPAVAQPEEPREMVVTTVDECPEGMAPISVYTNEDYPASMHWATAATRGIITLMETYYAPMIDGFVCKRHVSEVERLHPGMSYIYL